MSRLWRQVQAELGRNMCGDGCKLERSHLGLCVLDNLTAPRAAAVTAATAWKEKPTRYAPAPPAAPAPSGARKGAAPPGTYAGAGAAKADAVKAERSGKAPADKKGAAPSASGSASASMSANMSASASASGSVAAKKLGCGYCEGCVATADCGAPARASWGGLGTLVDTCGSTASVLFCARCLSTPMHAHARTCTKPRVHKRLDPRSGGATFRFRNVCSQIESVDTRLCTPLLLCHVL